MPSVYLKCVFVLEAVGDELPLAHVVQPVELPPRVLAAVEGSEPGQQSYSEIFIRANVTYVTFVTLTS